MKSSLESRITYKAGSVIDYNVLGIDCTIGCSIDSEFPDSLETAGAWRVVSQAALPNYRREDRVALCGLDFTVERRLCRVIRSFSLLGKLDFSCIEVDFVFGLESFRREFATFAENLISSGRSGNRYFLPLFGVLSTEDIDRIGKGILSSCVARVGKIPPSAFKKIFHRMAIVACFGDLDLALRFGASGIADSEFETQESILLESIGPDLYERYRLIE